jgi:hypothetical protein
MIGKYIHRNSISILRTNSATLTRSVHTYPEDLQIKAIKPSHFYAEQGDLLNWFYHVDHQGRIFAEETVPKNIATSIKAPKFLDFFFRQIQYNSALGKFADFAEYPWYSPCGKEHNFIKAAVTPVVFQDLDIESETLIWGATLTAPFDPSSLRIDAEGMLYHPLKTKRGFDTHCLIKSSLGVQLSERMEVEDVIGEGDDAKEDETHTPVGTFQWNDTTYNIHSLYR